MRIAVTGSIVGGRPPAGAPAAAAVQICFGLGALGLRPLLVGTAGTDFENQRIRLKQYGVDTDSVRIGPDGGDGDGDGDGGRAAVLREPDLADVCHRVGGDPSLVVVGPGAPGAMVRHARRSVELGIPFAASPGRGLGRLTRVEARALLARPRWLFTSEPDSVRLQERAALTEQQVLGRVGAAWVITRGAEGAVVVRPGRYPLRVPAVPLDHPAERAPYPAPKTAYPAEKTAYPAGHAFRAGFLTAAAWGLDVLRAAQLGCALAAVALENPGPQGYTPALPSLPERIRDAYGPDAAADLALLVPALVPAQAAL
ncbi:carbohydrate kinase family protein [Streptomyces sp. NPDC002851]